MRAFLFSVLLVACGGGADATDAPLSEQELLSEIMVQADRLNHCETVDDCEQKTVNCAAIFVNADADQTHLDDLITQHQAKSGNLACDTSCRCGLLRCVDNQCVGESGDCMTVPSDALQVCL